MQGPQDSVCHLSGPDGRSGRGERFHGEASALWKTGLPAAANKTLPRLARTACASGLRASALCQETDCLHCTDVWPRKSHK